jgi:signal transduction histidine kinase/ActR/RegA family two-component response regulator
MLWQTLLSQLVDQYGFRRIWYGRCAERLLRPVVLVPVSSVDMDELPLEVDESSAWVQSADVALPVSIEGHEEGRLLIDAGGTVRPDRLEQIRILTTEAATMLAERRSRLRNEEALRQARLQAEAANRTKSQFLANMSHEIRTPMTAVLGFADLLATTSLSAEQRDYVETVRSSGETLLALINDILDLSKIEAGKLVLDLVPLDVRSTVQRLKSLFTVQAAAKQLSFMTAVDPAVPQQIIGDPLRIRQVLTNLLGNAIKFTARGAVSLAVAARQRDEGGYALEFIVRDTGPGIPAEAHQSIFESFSQLDASTSRKHGGTGLGLSISRAIAEQMGGSLDVESEPGKGASFHFTIPVKALAEAPAPIVLENRPAPKEMKDLTRLNLLVADDNAVNRRVVVMFLERLGCHVDAVESGIELLQQMDRAEYDAVFVDVQMPGMDGLEATRRIRARGRPSPRIVALTAAAFPEDRARCLEAGMDDYLSKPVSQDDLARLLQGIRAAGGPGS